MDRFSQNHQAAQVNFYEQFQPINHNEAPHAWIFMGTIPASNMPGYVVDRYHNFVTGQYENRNRRKTT